MGVSKDVEVIDTEGSELSCEMTTRWGICGASRISHDFASAVGTLPKTDHEIVAIASKDISRAKDFAQVHDIATVYGSYEDLANDKNVEIVYIATLNPSHLELSKMMLNAGKHVLCEKPLTMNLKQATELTKLARSKDLFLMEAIWSRCFPAYEALREELANGSVGDVKQIFIAFGYKVRPEYDVTRIMTKKLGGGLILDMGVYAIQFALLVYGHERPTAIKAAGHLNEDGVDIVVSATLTFENGRTATFVLQAQVDLDNDAKIIGTGGTITLPKFVCPTRLELPSGALEWPLPETKHKHYCNNTAGLAYEAVEVRECLLKGLRECPKMSHAHSLLIAEIQDELRRQLGVVYEEDG